MTKLDRLARGTRDLLNALAAISDKGAAFKSLSDPWADTTTPHGQRDDYRARARWRHGSMTSASTSFRCRGTQAPNPAVGIYRSIAPAQRTLLISSIVRGNSVRFVPYHFTDRTELTKQFPKATPGAQAGV